MIFNEIYSAYYNTVANIIKEIIFGKVDNNSIYNIVQKYAFEESILHIIPAIKEERWQVITKNYKTPLKHVPTMPLTILQKRWLKSILNDERIKLFDIKVEGLEDVEPLFTSDDYCVFDKYLDGDNYKDEGYIERFKLILNATRKRLSVQAKMINRKGKEVSMVFIPDRIEYSEKDDKFRLHTKGCRYVRTVNFARLTKCSLYNGKNCSEKLYKEAKPSSVTLKITDERNALERTMMHFAHFEKQLEKIDENVYKAIIKYDSEDEPEMVIRVLSFGPFIEVVEPVNFINLIKEKLKKQQNCGLK